ncbi:MAG TPA: alpha/beta fold hydrolase [Sandaracinaceae bacterium LLY-WYZ-13_1]|nr:alpha/beta fold hydrolase [Sandaracinaceae bacterium LLY-WYZ-13_1]
MTILGLAAGLTALGCSVERRLFHFPPTPRDAPRAGDVFFRAADGTRLHGRVFESDDPHGPAVLYMHGNGQIVEGVDLRWLAVAGFHAMVFDWRGYGHSEGRPRDREGMLMDARAALEALARRPGVDPTRIGVAGWSMGGTFALVLAAREPRVRAVATLGAFASWQGVAHDLVPVAPAFVILPGLDPSTQVRHIDAPTLLLHGTTDRVVPVHHGRTLLRAATDAQRHVRATFLEGRGHYAMDRARPRMVRFFREHLRSER